MHVYKKSFDFQEQVCVYMCVYLGICFGLSISIKITSKIKETSQNWNTRRRFHAFCDVYFI